jgi:uncharacterized protein YndB with AHSA1/START domain
MSAVSTTPWFGLTCRVEADLPGTPAQVWALLTDAEGLPAWNPAVSVLRGPIQAGQRLHLEVPYAPGRVFRPTVTAFEPERRMVWSDGVFPFFRGDRTFTVEPSGAGARFVMEEVLRGAFVPMARRSLPDFRPPFDLWVSSLQAALRAG